MAKANGESEAKGFGHPEAKANAKANGHLRSQPWYKLVNIVQIETFSWSINFAIN